MRHTAIFDIELIEACTTGVQVGVRGTCERVGVSIERHGESS
jgi:hypothetical protein